MDETPQQVFTDVAYALRGDPDDDVTSDHDGHLRVRGKVFAQLHGDRLLVDLPRSRAEDLIARGIADVAEGPDARGVWVAVQDTDDWLELATEAHQFVGEPSVGRES